MSALKELREFEVDQACMIGNDIIIIAVHDKAGNTYGWLGSKAVKYDSNMLAVPLPNVRLKTPLPGQVKAVKLNGTKT